MNGLTADAEIKECHQAGTLLSTICPAMLTINSFRFCLSWALAVLCHGVDASHKLELT